MESTATKMKEVESLGSNLTRRAVVCTWCDRETDRRTDACPAAGCPGWTRFECASCGTVQPSTGADVAPDGRGYWCAGCLATCGRCSVRVPAGEMVESKDWGGRVCARCQGEDIGHG